MSLITFDCYDAISFIDNFRIRMNEIDFIIIRDSEAIHSFAIKQLIICVGFALFVSNEDEDSQKAMKIQKIRIGRIRTVSQIK